MKQHKEILIANSILKSKEALEDAKYNTEGLRLNAAQNRIYYAVFYSVMALGYMNDFVTSKHSQLMGWFNKKFIFESEIFSDELYAIYKTAYENRMKSDYEFTYKPDIETINKSFKDAEDFIDTIENYIKSSK